MGPTNKLIDISTKDIDVKDLKTNLFFLINSLLNPKIYKKEIVNPTKEFTDILNNMVRVCNGLYEEIILTEIPEKFTQLDIDILTSELILIENK